MRCHRCVGRRSRSLALCVALLAGLATTAPGGARAATNGPTLRAQPVKVLVAVLPFRVHSSQPLGHLETSLADLLASRLEASGRVRVVESLIVREALVSYAAGELTEDAVRRLARELDADYVVFGSLTELAGMFSLDVRVTPVESRAASDTMVLTAAGEEQLLERVNDLADRVLALVAGVPRQVVAEVRVEGVEGLEVDPRPLLRLRVGDVYDGDQARRDLAMLRGLSGVAAANVVTARGDEGVVVTYRVVPSVRILGRSTPGVSEDRVAEIRVRGNRRIEADAIRARIGTRVGDPFNPERIAQDVAEVNALGFFRNVRVFSDESLDGRVLIFEVEENPVVRRVTIAGNESVDGEKIRDALTLTTGSTLDYPLLFENRARIEALYRAQGYYLARVRHQIEPIADGAVAVNFEVEEGGKQRLRGIRFAGNEHFTEAELRRGLKTKPWRFWSYVTRFLDNSGTYSEPVFAQDMRSIEEKYTNAGFIQVEIQEPRVEVVENGLEVLVEVEEGSRYSVGKIDVRGDDSVDLEKLRELLTLEEGEHFDRSALTGDVERLTSYYTDRGFFLASVNPITPVSEADRIVDVVFDVEKGPLYFIREIDVAGNTATTDEVVRRELQLVEGQLYSARAIQVSQARVRGLGFFEEVDFEPRPTDEPDQLDMGVKVVEKPTGSLSFGAGFSSVDRFVVSGSLAQSNLFGRGYGVQASVDIGGRSNRFFFSFNDPYFLDSDFSMAATLFRTDVEFGAFDQEDTGLDLAFGHDLDERGRARAFARYNFSSREIEQDSGVNAASLIFREVLSGEQTTSLVGLSFRVDTRNDRVAPTKGFHLSGGVEFAGLGGFSQFVRFEGRGNYIWQTPDWFPVFGDRSALSFGARVGWAVPFNDISDYDVPDSSNNIDGGVLGLPEVRLLTEIDEDLKLPLSERYFLGGLGTFQLRGYKARSVGPRRAVLRRTSSVVDPVFGGNFGNTFSPVDYNPITRQCASLLDFAPGRFQGDLDGECNSLDDKDDDDFDDLDETDVIGGNKFLSLSIDYRFPISETLGLMGIVFVDMGNAFAEDDFIFDVGKWRFAAGVGALWFSPFGPLQGFIGLPLNRLEVEDSTAFEFSVGGANF